MANPSEEPLDLRKVHSESGRIVRLHPHHFLALAGLFVFPLSFCSFLLFTLLYSLSQTLSNGFLNFSQTPYHYLLLTILYSLFINLFSLFAVASISYSTYHLSDDETVDFISSSKSILYSFWPLVSTTLFVFITEVVIAIPYVLFVLVAFKWLHHSSVFILFVILFSLILVVALIYLQVNWILAYVVVVVESNWGYAPLQRSADLVKGSRGLTLSVLLYFELATGVILWRFLVPYGSGGWRFPFYLIFTSTCLTAVLLFSFVATTVLYVYFRESHDGLPLENPKIEARFPCTSEEYVENQIKL